MSSPDNMGDPDRLIVRDKRRLDPQSGLLREPVAPAPVAPAAPAPAAPASAAHAPDPTTGPGQVPTPGDEPALDAVAELTGDLQRLTAEYANYRKRVERDRVAVLEMATARVLLELLPLLDDVERARRHGDLTGGFKGVGESLESVTERLGLERYGAVGEPFDPKVHEAVMQAEPDPTASVPVCAMVLQPGFRVSGRVLRPAMVAVAEPTVETTASETTASQTTTSQTTTEQAPEAAGWAGQEPGEVVEPAVPVDPAV